jgi:hypothetical protein
VLACSVGTNSQRYMSTGHLHPPNSNVLCTKYRGRTAHCGSAVTCFGLLPHTVSSYSYKPLKQGKGSEKNGRKGGELET